MAEIGTEQPVKRRSRSRRSRSSSSPATRISRSVAAIPERRLDLAMALLAVLLVGIGWYEFNQARSGYPEIWLGATRSEVRYGFGNPNRDAQAGGRETWTYLLDGATVNAVFEGDRVVEAGCSAQAGNCPALLGLDTAAMEDLIWTRLGAPTHQRIAQGTKLLEYDELGVTLELQRFKLFRISVHRASGDALAALGRFVLLILP